MKAVDVIVQRVRTTWSKQSRGNPGAALRSAVPEAFPLPAAGAPLFHDITVAEDEDFVPREAILPQPPAAAFGLRLVGNALRVQLPNGHGAPARAPRPVLTLRRGDWLRWHLNNRHAEQTGWYYSQTTVSIAFGPTAPDTFLGAPPHTIDERARLR
ncbi:hypothetical protein ACWT_2851 [Actinoplanes sp. SE50]|nr:hypothetical protein ACPL_2695 [Actinoplanes sp. SE50/110]ATO82266.1 hypothetical protein ACWT_2851 [Actinoplanes sp. SE50]SLL99673.1 hypothetical protein ACSP50_2904 [Actinoplanes sp. SE50/110]